MKINAKGSTSGLKIKSKVRAGGVQAQHAGTSRQGGSGTPKAGLKIKTKVRAGGLQPQHAGTLIRASAK
jgi:hypothetical protein